jgi:hypothetical protein
MAKLQLNTDRKAFEIKRGGETTKWEYDVLELKLTAENLEREHGMRHGDKVKPPTIEFLRQFASILNDEFGLVGCSSDIAFRVYNVVNAQFVELQDDLELQLKAATE